VALSEALAPVRVPLRPELEEQTFAPHLTLALGLGEDEAARMVSEMRGDPIEAGFVVDSVYVVSIWNTDGSEKVERTQVRFGKAPLPIGLLSD
jgi:hypothetical protein